MNSLTEPVLTVNKKKVDTLKVGLSSASCDLTPSPVPFLKDMKKENIEK